MYNIGRGENMNWWITFSILLVALGLVLIFNGLRKKSLLSMFFGITSLLVPIFYSLEWLKPFVPFIPLVAMGIAYPMKKRLTTD